MPKMTKAQAKKRIREARKKLLDVYTQYHYPGGGRHYPDVGGPIRTADMAAFDKIFDKCLKRLG